jgi:hypothetical protein
LDNVPKWNWKLKLENVWQAKDLQARFLDVWQGKDLRDFSFRARGWWDAGWRTGGVEPNTTGWWHSSYIFPSKIEWPVVVWPSPKGRLAMDSQIAPL